MKRLLLFLLTACSYSTEPLPDTYAVYVDPAFSEEERLTIRTAMANWEAKTPVVFDTVIASCPLSEDYRAGVFCIHRSALDFVSSLPGANRNMLAATQIGGSHTYLAMDRLTTLGGAYLLETIAHELGHELGLRHRPAPALMCPDNSPPVTQVTADDVRQYAEVRGRK